jgi:hypothetical protein
MLHSLALAHPVQGYNARFHAVSIADTGPNVVQFLDRARDQKASLTSPLDRCREGWAKAISHPAYSCLRRLCFPQGASYLATKVQTAECAGGRESTFANLALRRSMGASHGFTTCAAITPHQHDPPSNGITWR